MFCGRSVPQLLACVVMCLSVVKPIYANDIGVIRGEGVISHQRDETVFRPFEEAFNGSFEFFVNTNNAQSVDALNYSVVVRLSGPNAGEDVKLIGGGVTSVHPPAVEPPTLVTPGILRSPTEYFLGTLNFGTEAFSVSDGAGLARVDYQVEPGVLGQYRFQIVTGDTAGTNLIADLSNNSHAFSTESPTLTVLPTPAASEPIADSSQEFSGVQGQDNWYYGYYDVRDDIENGNGIYTPDEFIPFLNDGSNVVSNDPDFGAWKNSPNHWHGTWDLLDNSVVEHGPWTEIQSVHSHPAANAQGDQEVHWAIRRWVSELDGGIRMRGTISNESANGDGTVGRIFVDGGEVWSQLTDGDSFDFEVDIPVSVGSVIDFATDPDGANVLDEVTGVGLDDINDGNDSTLFNFQVFPLLGLEAGDADQDLDFDQQDIVKVAVAGKYLTAQLATWGEGDWDGAPGGGPGNSPSGDGLFNEFDIIAALQAGIYLTGSYVAVNPSGQDNDGQTSIVYDARTGELAVDAPAASELTSINIESAAGIFTGQPAQNLGGSFDNDSETNIFKATFGSSFGSLSFGNVAQPGLGENFLVNDLSVVGSLQGGGGLGEVDLIYIPEPSAFVLVCLGMLGLLASSKPKSFAAAFRRFSYSQSNADVVVKSIEPCSARVVGLSQSSS